MMGTLFLCSLEAPSEDVNGDPRVALLLSLSVPGVLEGALAAPVSWHQADTTGETRKGTRGEGKVK